MSYGWIIVIVAFAVVAVIWLVGIYWRDMKQWWDWQVAEHDRHRTFVRDEGRERRQAGRKARKEGTAVDP